MKGLAVLLLALPGCAFACSGANVSQIIRENEMVGTIQATIVAVFLLVSALLSLGRKRGWAATAVLGAMFLLHPRWIFSVASGDCGSGVAMMSPLATGLAAGVLTLQILALWRALKVPSAAVHG